MFSSAVSTVKKMKVKRQLQIFLHELTVTGKWETIVKEMNYSSTSLLFSQFAKTS